VIEVNGRYDGSSKFPEDEQYAFFPSVSAGWRLSEEPFWKVDRDIISDVKIRGSYGSLGNGNVGSYSFQELLDIKTSGRVLNGALNKYTSAPDPIPEGLTWETATTTDIGLDFSMVKGKLRFTGDYYVRKTTDMYTVGVTLPDVFGADSPKGNYADMTTKGWEIALNWKDKFILSNRPFSYEVRATMSDYTSTIDRYNNSTKSLDDYYEGMKIGEIWGYKTDGLFQSEDEISGYVNTIIKSSSNGTVYPGDLKFVDNNNSGKIDYGDETVDDPGDKVILGNSKPRYIYSFMLNADWKGFFFSAFFQGVGKQNWFPDKESGFWGQYNRPYNNLPKWHLNNYWSEDNPDAYLPRYTGYNKSLGYGNTITDRYLQNVAYIRLKNFQFGYTLPKSLTSKIRMQNARIYISGENLWSWSPLYKHTRDFDVTNTQGSDPDLTSGTSGDNYSYPLMKSISLGLSVTF
jgi:TonB-linked SusC/RagA family outer membrane protein